MPNVGKRETNHTLECLGQATRLFLNRWFHDLSIRESGARRTDRHDTSLDRP